MAGRCPARGGAQVRDASSAGTSCWWHSLVATLGKGAGGVRQGWLQQWQETGAWDHRGRWAKGWAPWWPLWIGALQTPLLLLPRTWGGGGGACIGHMCSPTTPSALTPALAPLWHLHPRGSLLPGQNQPVFPAAKQWRSIPKTAMNSLAGVEGKQGACRVGGAELEGGRGAGDGTFAIKRKVAAQKASVITSPG